MAARWSVLVALLVGILAAAPASAGDAGKDPACVGGCGSELRSCLAGCRPNTACFDRCKSISALRVDEILTCQNGCSDEISICEDLCGRYNRDCLDRCPSK